MARRRRIHISALPLLTLLLMALFLRLGFWQLQRAEEKRDWLRVMQQRGAQPPGTLHSLLALPEQDQDWRRLHVKGEYDPVHVYLLDNAIRDAQVGYEVLQPFRDDSAGWLLVNRGWVKASAYRDVLPSVPTPADTVELLGTARLPVMGPAMDSGAASWPRVIQRLDLDNMATQLGRPLPVLLMRIDPASPGALRAEWPLAQVNPERHEAYAWQWFSFAGVLPLLVIIAGYKLSGGRGK